VFKEIGNDGVEWIQVAQDMIKWWHSNDPLAFVSSGRSSSYEGH